MYNTSLSIKYAETAHVSQVDFEAYAEKLLPYQNKLVAQVWEDTSYSYDESSICLSKDHRMREHILARIKDLKNAQLKYIVVVGIGGSNLGCKAIYDALHVDDNQYPHILFADTVSTNGYIRIKSILSSCVKDSAELLMVVISKSGTTFEVSVNITAYHALLTELFGPCDHRIVVITEKDSPLWKKAVDNKWTTIEHPSIGGRFSIFSPVGIVPLALTGFDVRELHDGAFSMAEQCIGLTDFDPYSNPALMSAIILHSHALKGRTINNNFYFNPELGSLGMWFRQLLGESIGKKMDKTGAEVRIGITPLVSIGSTDLHSVGQLYYEGPDDKITTFMYVPRETYRDNNMKQQYFAPPDLSVAMDAIFRGVLTSYREQGLPYFEICVDEISLFSLGQYMQYKMIEIMYLAELFGINAFDQPGVEHYKLALRHIVGK